MSSSESMTRGLACAGATVAALLALAPPVAGQGSEATAPLLVGAGLGHTYTKINNQKVWGINARVQSYLGRYFVYRGYAAFDFVESSDETLPTIAYLGGEVGFVVGGVRWDAPFALTIALGVSGIYFASGSEIVESCPEPDVCRDVNVGYEPGLALALTGAGGFEVRLAPRFALFGDIRIYGPARLGEAGYATDPHSAFVGVAFGLLMRK